MARFAYYARSAQQFDGRWGWCLCGKRCNRIDRIQDVHGTKIPRTAKWILLKLNRRAISSISWAQGSFEACNRRWTSAKNHWRICTSLLHYECHTRTSRTLSSIANILPGNVLQRRWSCWEESDWLKCDCKFVGYRARLRWRDDLASIRGRTNSTLDHWTLMHSLPKVWWVHGEEAWELGDFISSTCTKRNEQQQHQEPPFLLQNSASIQC